jgi:hypothetical protein
MELGWNALTRSALSDPGYSTQSWRCGFQIDATLVVIENAATEGIVIVWSVIDYTAPVDF